MSVRTFPFPSRFAPAETGVSCPACKQAELVTRFSCLEARYTCPHCDKLYTLADLAPALNEEEFERLALTVDDRYSNRV